MSDFWEGKKVLITGADGFIGSHLVEHLQKKGAQIRALSLYNSFNNWGWLEHIASNKNVEIVTGDIRDPETCYKITFDIEIIFHLACLIAIPYSIQSPRSYLDSNVYGTFNICEAALKNNCKLIYISSSEVYGTALYLPIDEKHPLQAQSPYSATKISAEAIVYSFFRSYNLHAVIVRPFNTYGPRQSARAIIPSVIIQLAGGKDEIKVGNLSPRRDLNFVADTCAGMTLIAENEDLKGETINIGSGTDYPVKNILSLICKLMNKTVKVVTDIERIRPASAEVEHLLCDNRKIKKTTGFVSHYDLEKGLKETIDWFLKPENLVNYKSHLYNV